MSVAHVLVVDDEKDIRTLIEEILADEGYRVSSAADAEEARQQVANKMPDLVCLGSFYDFQGRCRQFAAISRWIPAFL
jgi:DNA-binding response OmpR family regulator